MVWEAVLDELETGRASLRQFAPELMRSAARAVQEGVRLGSQGSEEEALLVRALARVRERCRRESLVALSLLSLDATRTGGAIQRRPRAPDCRSATTDRHAVRRLPSRSGRQALLAQAPAGGRLTIRSSFAPPASRRKSARRLTGADRLLAEDGTRRLLIVSALAEPRLPALGNLLWRALSAGTAQETAAAA